MKILSVITVKNPHVSVGRGKKGNEHTNICLVQPIHGVNLHVQCDARRPLTVATTGNAETELYLTIYNPL